METVLLGAISLIVGFFCGCTSIGGILLIPGIVLFSALGIHEAMATALFSFALMAVLGTFMHSRKKAIRWREACMLCTGALICGFAGARVNALFSADMLNIVLAVLVLFAGISTLRPGAKPLYDVTAARPAVQYGSLLALGMLVGFMAGLTGIGGPVISVPFMIAMGYAPIVSIAVAQPMQVVAGVSGSIFFMLNGTIDYVMAAWITILELIGMYTGVCLAYRMNARSLRIFISILCIATALYLFVRG